MTNGEQYFHWIWGENKLRDDNPEYLINLEIGVSIRFNYELAMYSTFEEFVNEISDVQFIYGNKPDKEKVDFILTEAWNYLCLEEQKLDDDLNEFEDF